MQGLLIEVAWCSPPLTGAILAKLVDLAGCTADGLTVPSSRVLGRYGCWYCSRGSESEGMPTGKDLAAARRDEAGCRVWFARGPDEQVSWVPQGFRIFRGDLSTSWGDSDVLGDAKIGHEFGERNAPLCGGGVVDTIPMGRAVAMCCFL
jgi:hypothetical protein